MKSPGFSQERLLKVYLTCLIRDPAIKIHVKKKIKSMDKLYEFPCGFLGD